METKSQTSLSKRIQVTCGVNVEDLECIICTDLLWKPIACNNCDSLYCSECIKSWLVKSPENCPHCQNYVERRCSPFIIKQLAKLQFACINQSNGCPEIIGYEVLEKHEIECGYKLQQCSGCHSTVLEKELAKHEDDCESIRLTCSECNITYSRCDASSHTEITCLREQLRQFRQDSDAYKQHQSQIIEQQNSTIQNLQQEFTTDKQQQAEIINRLTAQLEQQKFGIQKHERTTEELSQQLNQLLKKFLQRQELATPGAHAKLHNGKTCVTPFDTIASTIPTTTSSFSFDASTTPTSAFGSTPFTAIANTRAVIKATRRESRCNPNNFPIGTPLATTTTGTIPTTTTSFSFGASTTPTFDSIPLVLPRQT
ncbi:unnamed protein product [Adineta steineri]|uniref:RING-type domain-containing protein n=1 Tax=Adineta steineri TaxID=433720 RepID=A0A815YHV0_9BILA|nr:unnamed protein product [Adineta steineri]CAF1571108.1 unnamed protein product [Adineta steineri]